MSKQFLITIITLIVIAVAAVVAVYFVKGFIFSPTEGRMVGTGIMSVTSTPTGASVYIDGHLATATNTTLSQLKPKDYNVKIVKEGFISWEKQVTVSEGLVSEIKATLFPALPTIYPLTFNGVTKSLLSSDGQKLAFAVPFSTDSSIRQKGGIWVWTMTSTPISFTRGNQPQQIVSSTIDLDFSKADLRFSPDSTQLLVTLQAGGVEGEASQRNYQLPVDRLSSLTDLRDITPLIANTNKSWNDDQNTEDQARILAIKDLNIRNIASKSGVLKWSPDETKFLAGPAPVVEVSPTPFVVKNSVTPTSTPIPTPAPRTLLKGYKVYDLINPIRVELTTKPTVSLSQLQAGQYKEYTLPDAYAYYWLPNSRHIIMVMEDKVGIADFDGTNLAVIFAGKFDGNNVFAWPDSSKLVLLTSFATSTASVSNLFGINLK